MTQHDYKFVNSCGTEHILLKHGVMPKWAPDMNHDQCLTDKVINENKFDNDVHTMIVPYEYRASYNFIWDLLKIVS